MFNSYEIRPPREDERADLFKLFYACFPAAKSLFEQAEKGKRPISDYLCGYEPLVMLIKDRIAANVSIIRRRIFLGGKSIAMGGIGSVATHPDFRQKGYAKILMEEVLRAMIDEGTYISILLTEVPWAYESLGWKIVPQAYLIIDLGDQKDNKIDKNISITGELKEVRSIIPLYNETAPTLSGAIDRDEKYWEDYYLTGIVGFENSGDKVLLYKEDSQLLGYARLHDENTHNLLAEIIVKKWDKTILEKLLRAAIKVTSDKGYKRLVLGLQENHPLRKQVAEMGLNPVEEKPEGIRELCMINQLVKLSEVEKYLKRLHWCYHDKF